MKAYEEELNRVSVQSLLDCYEAAHKTRPTWKKKKGNIAVKILLQLGFVGIAFIPTYLILLANSVLNPEGFWQMLLCGVAGLYLLGGIQLVFIVVLINISALLWSD